MTLPLGFVPPVLFRDRFVGACITRDSCHNLKIILFDDLLDHLDSLEVTKHITRYKGIYFTRMNMTDLHSPDGTDHAAVGYGLRYLERLFDSLLWPGGNRLLHEERNAGKAAQDLDLNVATRACGTAEHGRRADNKGARAFAG
jgi:hypothetical protein